MSFDVLKKNVDKVFTVDEHAFNTARFIILTGLSITLLIVIFSVSAVSQTALVMVTDKACPFCQAWEREVGKIYPKTDLAQEFPLVRLELKDTLPGYNINFSEVRGTPSFIFLRDNNEIGRIEGFSDVEMFWWLVDDIVAQVEIMKE